MAFVAKIEAWRRAGRGMTGIRGGLARLSPRELFGACGVALVILVTTLLGVTIAAVSGGDNADEEATADPGPPFSIEAQQDLLQLDLGREFITDPGAPRCEVMVQIVEHLPADTSGRLTAEQAAAAAGPIGSLRVTVEHVTQDPEVLDAVGECVPFYVGRRYGAYG